jgi:hypothetical protein
MQNSSNLLSYDQVKFEASKDAYLLSCHYLKMKHGNPHPHASGVFLKVGEESFLLTAAHVIEKQEEDIFIGIEDHLLLRLGGDLIWNKAPNSRNQDRIDIAIHRLCPETIQRIGNKYKFLDSSELGINHGFIQSNMYQSIGFPATMSKFNAYKQAIKSKPFIFNTRPADREIYKQLQCDEKLNIIVVYDKNKIVNYKTGKQQTGPDPYGISGSGLWFIPYQEKSAGEKLEKRLVAIMTEWPIENRKCWIGTRIDVFTELIRIKYRLGLEQSKLVKLNFKDI